MQDRELLFQMLASKSWDELSECLYLNKALLSTDLVIKQAVSLFESEFIDYLDTLTASEKLKKLRHIALLVEYSESSFAENFVNRLIDIKLRAMYEIGDIGLVGYASNYQNRPLARELLEKIRSQRPEHFAEAKRPAVSVKAASTQKNKKSITSIFKSPQERNFYLAIKEEFPQFLACPNIPMSTVLNLEVFKADIDFDMREYYFKAVFDCVVVDPKVDYQPIAFFELDSRYHDEPVAKKNDELKNSICNSAGVKLTRIRAFKENETNIDAFRSLLKDLIKHNDDI